MSGPQLQQTRNIVRLPFYEDQYNRESASGLPTVTSGYDVIDTKLVNCWAEKYINQYTQTAAYRIQRRPGLVQDTRTGGYSAGATNIIPVAILPWKTIGAAVFVICYYNNADSNLYFIKYTWVVSGSTVVTLGNFNPGAGFQYDVFLSETISSGTPTLVVSIPSINKGYYSIGGGAASLTPIADVDFPGNIAGKQIAGGFAYLNGYAFIATTDASVYNSNLNDITSWDPLNVLSANQSPDNAVGLVRYKQFILVLGDESIEFLEDVSNAVGSPLQKTQQAYLKMGCVGGRSIFSDGDSFYWLARSSTSAVSGLWRLNGFTPEPVSMPYHNEIFTGDAIYYNLTGLSGDGRSIPMYPANLFGKNHIVINAPVNFKNINGDMGSQTSGLLCYNITDNTWWIWGGVTNLHVGPCVSTTTMPYANLVIGSPGTSSLTVNFAYIVFPSTNALGGTQDNVYMDNGTSFPMMIQTKSYDFNSERRKRLNKIAPIYGRGIGDGSASLSTTMNIYWSDDDYQTWSTGRSIDLTSNRAYLKNCGTFRKRAFIFTVPAARKAFPLYELELEIQTNTH